MKSFLIFPKTKKKTYNKNLSGRHGQNPRLFGISFYARVATRFSETFTKKPLTRAGTLDALVAPAGTKKGEKPFKVS